MPTVLWGRPFLSLRGFGKTLRATTRASPAHGERFRTFYKNRVAVEREFGRLKNDYGLSPLRVRGLKRVQLHADLVMLARLSLALSRARAVPLAA